MESFKLTSLVTTCTDTHFSFWSCSYGLVAIISRIFCNLKGIRFPLLPAGPKPAAAAVFRRSYLGMGLIPALMRKESDGIRCKSEMNQISEIRKTKQKSPDSNQFSNFKSFCAHFDGQRLLCLVCDQVII